MCDNLIFRLVLFSTANSRTGETIARKMDVLDKCEFRIGGVGPSIGKQSKNHLKKSSSRRDKIVWLYLSHSLMDMKVVVLFLAVHRE